MNLYLNWRRFQLFWVYWFLMYKVVNLVLSKELFAFKLFSSNLRALYENCETKIIVVLSKVKKILILYCTFQLMKKIVVGTRTMEIIGLCVSLVSCVTSLFIFCYFRTLRCHRTRIHRNLLLAIVVQVIIRLVLYIDQYIARERQSDYLAATGSYIAIFHTVQMMAFYFM